MILIIDNYDSFTYNLLHLLRSEYEFIKLIKNDEMDIDKIKNLNPKALVISPGPGRPEDAGICIEAINFFCDKIPILGVCLGHQAIGIAFGANVVKARNIIHGKIDKIHHTNHGILKGLGENNEVVRYHSLVIDDENVPKCLRITSLSSIDNQIMSIEHKEHKVFGVQFHPESYSTSSGKLMIKNFVSFIDKEE